MPKHGVISNRNARVPLTQRRAPQQFTLRALCNWHCTTSTLVRAYPTATRSGRLDNGNLQLYRIGAPGGAALPPKDGVIRYHDDGITIMEVLGLCASLEVWCCAATVVSSPHITQLVPDMSLSAPFLPRCSPTWIYHGNEISMRCRGMQYPFPFCEM